MKVRVLAASILLLALPGCFTNEDAGPPEEGECPRWPLDHEDTQIVDVTFNPIEGIQDRNQALDHATYAYRTCNLPPIGWTALRETGEPHKYLGEIDMRADLGIGAVAVVGNDEAPRVYVVDITNGSAPRTVAAIDLSNAYVTDVKISTDGKILYIASQKAGGYELPDLNVDPSAPLGFMAYNIENRASPRYLGTVADTNAGCHMLSAVQVAPTQDVVFCVSNLIRGFRVERGGAALVNLGSSDFVPTANGAPYVAPGVVNDLVDQVPDAPHDMTPYFEGGSYGKGKSYLVVSYWDLGVRVVDISSLPLMTEVAGWGGQGAKHYHGNVHTAMMFDVGDKRYLMASPEYTARQAKEVPSLWLLDATNLGDLKLVGEWFHPGEHVAQGLYLTTHQWQVAPTGKDVKPEDARVYLTYNHAGVWVLRFADILERDHAGAILGFNLARTPIPSGPVPNAILSTWDVNVADGYIYGSDRATGLWVFHYEGDRLGDTRLRGFA